MSLMRPAFLLFGFAMMAALVSASPCGAAEWHEVSRNSDTGATISVDDSSVSGKQYIAKGWVRIDYLSPRERDGQRLTGYAAQWQANCQNHTYWTSESYGFRPDKAEPVRLYRTDQEWQPVFPGGDESVALEALCEETKSLVGKVIDKAGELFHEYVEGIK